MQRAFRVLMLIVVAASITGCGESGSVNDTETSPTGQGGRRENATTQHQARR